MCEIKYMYGERKYSQLFICNGMSTDGFNLCVCPFTLVHQLCHLYNYQKIQINLY